MEENEERNELNQNPLQTLENFKHAISIKRQQRYVHMDHANKMRLISIDRQQIYDNEKKRDLSMLMGMKFDNTKRLENIRVRTLVTISTGLCQRYWYTNRSIGCIRTM